jgi:hypothetical protein
MSEWTTDRRIETLRKRLDRSTALIALSLAIQLLTICAVAYSFLTR